MGCGMKKTLRAETKADAIQERRFSVTDNGFSFDNYMKKKDFRKKDKKENQTKHVRIKEQNQSKLSQNNI